MNNKNININQDGQDSQASRYGQDSQASRYSQDNQNNQEGVDVDQEYVDACRDDVKYRFGRLADTKCCTNGQKIEKFIRDRLGKEFVVFQADPRHAFVLLYILHDEGVIYIPDVRALAVRQQKSKFVYFFIEKTETLMKEFDVQMDERDNWIGITVTEDADFDGQHVPMLKVKTLFAAIAKDEAVDAIINTIMLY